MVDKNCFKRTEYAHHEQQKIVDYIVKNKYYNVLRGNIIWQEMQEAKVVDRTWQSVKEHFRKKIINILHIFNISSKERLLIQEGWERTSKVRHDKSGKQIKRPRYVKNEFSDEDSPEKPNYKISDSSDLSDSFTQEPVNVKRKQSNKTSTLLKSSAISYLSDEEAGSSHQQYIQISDSDQYSPDLLAMNNPNKTILNIPTSSSDGDKTPENLDKLPNAISSTSDTHLKNTSHAVDSDSDTVVVLDTTTSTCSSKSSQEEDVDFSEKDDLEIIQFMRRDQTYLKERNELRVYKLFCELYYKNHPKKSPRQVRRRFLNYIFPNIYKFQELTSAEKFLIYVDADAEIPENLKKSIGNTLNSSETHENSEIEIHKKTTSEQQTQTNFGMNVCDHSLNESELNCIYCNIELNGERHLFVSTMETDPDKEKLITILTKRLKIQLQNIHFVDFSSYFLLGAIQNFRNSIYKQFGTAITNGIAEDSFVNIDIERVISDLEICIQPFSLDDDDSCSESSSNTEEINTQGFNPTDNSTPQRQVTLNIKEEPQDVQDITVISNVKEENHSYRSCPNISANLREHNYSAFQVSAKVNVQDNQNNSKFVDNELIQPDNTECEINTTEFFSQCLESSPETVDVQNTISRMVEKTFNTQTSTDTFYSACNKN